MRRAIARTLLAVWALGAAVALTGCSASTTIQTAAGRSIIVSGQGNHAQEDALADGTVSWGDGGCMVIDIGEEGEAYLIVFPHGTTIDDAEVELPQGFRMQAGDDVSLGGGFHLAGTTDSS